MTLTRRLLVAIALLVAYGSLYPFEFAAPRADAWRRFLAGGALWTSSGDVIGNVLLFVPLGALGTRLLPRPSPGVLAALLAALLAYALALQVAQLWLPMRNAALADVWWNGVGASFGIAVALAWHGRPRPRALQAAERTPALLLGLWTVAQLAPFVPRLDWEAIKQAAKPLLQPQWEPIAFGLALAGALALGCVVRALSPDARRAVRRLALLLAAALASRLFIAGRALDASVALGMLVGWAASAALMRQTPVSASRVALVLLLLGYTVAALAPFQWRAAPAPFHWLPFEALLQGAMLVNAWALAQTLFVLGALLWLAHTAGADATWSTAALAAYVGALEAAQRWVAGRVADVTAPLLVLALGLLIAQLAVTRPATPAPRTPAARCG